MLRFGEFAENLRETSPGLLDHFGKPAATLISAKGESPLTVTKAANGFVLSAGAGQGQQVAAHGFVVLLAVPGDGVGADGCAGLVQVTQRFPYGLARRARSGHLQVGGFAGHGYALRRTGASPVCQARFQSAGVTLDQPQAAASLLTWCRLTATRRRQPLTAPCRLLSSSSLMLRCG
ncbi:hypothetical protein D9M71_648520 [compost metagenome]